METIEIVGVVGEAVAGIEGTVDTEDETPEMVQRREGRQESLLHSCEFSSSSAWQ